MKRKVLVVTLLSVMMIVMLTGCMGGGAKIDRPAMSAGAAAVEVTGSCQAVLNGDVLTVSGESNVIDGTLGTISVYSYEGKELGVVKITKAGDNLKQDFTVTDDWPAKVYGFITFDTYTAGTQSDAVLGLYGKQFENMTGDNVLWDSKGVAVVFQSEMVEIPAPVG